MEHGAVVTNLDGYSSGYYVHMENIIDIDECDLLPAGSHISKELSERAKKTPATLVWDNLIAVLGSAPVA